MTRIVWILLVAGVGYGMWLGYERWSPIEHTIDGRWLTVTSGGLGALFERGDPYSETYIIFGGSQAGFGFVCDAGIAGIELQGAAWLARQYPDFYRCNSPGAAQAKDMMKDLRLLAADQKVRRALRKAIRHHETAIASSGDRVCVALSGERLDLNEAWLRHNEKDITDELRQGGQHPRFLYVELAKIVDCQALP
jgi:hypothetical protein